MSIETVMRFSPARFILPALSLVLSTAACDGLLGVDFDDARARASSDGGDSTTDGGSSTGDGPDTPLIPTSKVDLLLVVDNSASMGDKSNLLASSIGTLIRDIARVGDVHVGVISSSLGDYGGDVCDASGNPRANDRAHLRTTGPDGQPLASASAGFLQYQGGDVEALVKDTEALVRGVGETGCGFEAQLEAMYRFLVQPDPWLTVTRDAYSQVDFGTGVDFTLLAQRKAFLRPDSALVVIMLTDEDDSSIDPLSIGGQGWAFTARQFPGSKVLRGSSSVEGTTAPRATSACKTNPASPDCTSCGFQHTCDETDPACQKIKADPNCRLSGRQGQSGDGYDGYYAPDEDDFNVRFHRMKERFGVDPQFPISRYVDGLTSPKVPDRASEHPVTMADDRRVIADYAGTPTCTNPIFAASLPGGAGEELCNLPQGSRSRELVVFAVLGGVPEQLVSDTPDWEAILGRNPGAYDLTGIDPHMLQSVTPRAGLEGPSTAPGDNGSDPVHGREWNTYGRDLQYACTFTLPTPRQCTANDTSCDCTPGRTTSPPLCGVNPSEQLKAKAYPTPRPLRVAQGLGQRGVIGSICASQGYDATMKRLSQRLASRLAK